MQMQALSLGPGIGRVETNTKLRSRSQHEAGYAWLSVARRSRVAAVRIWRWGSEVGTRPRPRGTGATRFRQFLLILFVLALCGDVITRSAWELSRFSSLVSRRISVCQWASPFQSDSVLISSEALWGPRLRDSGFLAKTATSAKARRRSWHGILAGVHAYAGNVADSWGPDPLTEGLYADPNCTRSDLWTRWLTEMEANRYQVLELRISVAQRLWGGFLVSI